MKQFSSRQKKIRKFELTFTTPAKEQVRESVDL